MPDTQSCVVLLSGGMDSSTLLAHVLNRWPNGNHVAISFNYGQRHDKELDAAWAVAQYYNIGHRTADLRNVGTLFMYGSSQTDATVDVPYGHYTDESMKLTVVPNRNMIMLSIATAWAIASRRTMIAYAAHAGDHAIYPDCRPAFVAAMRDAIYQADWTPPTIYAPYLYGSKADILKEGLELNVPYKLTWTCYEGGERPCGKCGTCVERAEAFALLKTGDPLEVRR